MLGENLFLELPGEILLGSSLSIRLHLNPAGGLLSHLLAGQLQAAYLLDLLHGLLRVSLGRLE